MLKQLKLLYGEGFSEDERHRRKENIYSNIIESMQALCNFAASR